MTLIGMHVSSLRLLDVKRRSLYVSVTLCGHTAWVQWWPRGHKRFLTAGVRHE